MCLTRVTETFDPPSEETGFGWKVFVEQDEGYYNCPLFDCYLQVFFRKGIWVTDTHEGTLKGPYRTGFHLFVNYEDAVRWNISPTGVHRVEYTNVVAKGTQTFKAAVIVARKIRIIG